MREVSAEESREKLIDLLGQIVSAYESISIPYYLAYGTLLGAVWHKGFIPWDDDIDICVPVEYLAELMKKLK